MHPLLAQIVASPWLISPALAQQYLPMVEGLAAGQAPGLVSADVALARRRAARPRDFALQLSSAGAVLASAPIAGGKASAKAEGNALNVRLLSLSGPVLKDDQECGPLGMSTLARYVQAWGQDPNVDAIVFRIDSPGGQVYGTQSLADAIKQCPKPTVALCDDGMMCSAAYWIGSSADRVLATHETCTIGSIGVMATWADTQGMAEKKGVKFHEVYAAQSTKKNADFAAAKSGDYAPMQAKLSAICDQFIGAVQANMGEQLDVAAATKAGAFAGDTFSASEALALGLIHGIGSLQDAFAQCASLVQAQRADSSSASTSSSNMGLFDKKATLGVALMALVGAETVTAEMASAATAELKAGGITGAALLPSAAMQEMETAAGQLAAMTSERDTALASAKGMSDALAAAGAADMGALVASRDEWKTKAEAYGSQPGAMGTSAKKAGDDAMGEPSQASANDKLVADLHAKMLGEG